MKRGYTESRALPLSVLPLPETPPGSGIGSSLFFESVPWKPNLEPGIHDGRQRKNPDGLMDSKWWSRSFTPVCDLPCLSPIVILWGQLTGDSA